MDHDYQHVEVPALRAEALEAILVEKGLLTPARVDEVIARYNDRIGPLRGAQIVARAWLEPEFKAQLLADANHTIAEYEFDGGEIDKLVVVENTALVHNIVVCTLCSCYPWAVLGLPPRWYKDPAYRSRVVREPRRVLTEMGVELEPDTSIRVWDSSAEIRYMVLPQRPEGTEDLSLGELASRVTRDSMIGVARLD